MNLRGVLRERVEVLGKMLVPDIGRDPLSVVLHMLGAWDAVEGVVGEGPREGVVSGYGTILIDMRDEYDELWIAVWDGEKDVEDCAARIKELESALVVSRALCADMLDTTWKKGLGIREAVKKDVTGRDNRSKRHVLRVPWYAKHARPGQHAYLAPLRALDQRVCGVCRNARYPWIESGAHDTERFVAMALRRAVQLLLLGYRSRLAIACRVGVSLQALNDAYDRGLVARPEDCMFPVCRSEGLCSTDTGVRVLTRIRYWDSGRDCWLQHYPPSWFGHAAGSDSGRARAALVACREYEGGEDAFMSALANLYGIYDAWWRSRSKNTGGAPRRRRGWPKYGIRRVLEEAKMTQGQLEFALKLANSF